MTTLTVAQRDALVENMRLELNNRINRLRSQHQLAARALRNKIEMRINRVPKRVWNLTLRQLDEEKTRKDNGQFGGKRELLYSKRYVYFFGGNILH